MNFDEEWIAITNVHISTLLRRIVLCTHSFWNRIYICDSTLEVEILPTRDLELIYHKLNLDLWFPFNYPVRKLNAPISHTHTKKKKEKRQEFVLSIFYKTALLRHTSVSVNALNAGTPQSTCVQADTAQHFEAEPEYTDHFSPWKPVLFWLLYN